jgi:hypothetical protein
MCSGWNSKGEFGFPDPLLRPGGAFPVDLQQCADHIVAGLSVEVIKVALQNREGLQRGQVKKSLIVRV